MPYLGRTWRTLLAPLVLMLGWMTPARSQAPTASANLSGVVTDPSGAKVFRANVHVRGAGPGGDVRSDVTGRFSLDLPAGSYDVTVSFASLQNYKKQVTLQVGDHVELAVVLNVPPHEEEVFVPSDAWAATDPEANLGAITFKGAQLAMFSDDGETFQRQLDAITGGGDAPPQIFVDGFSGGRIPPKSAIREIRINQNPFSAQYDRQGLNRIDILTKPGTEKLHGDISFSFDNNDLNARNPYVGAEPPYHTLITDGSVNGPLGKKMSFFLSGNHTSRQNNAIINALNLDQNFQPVTISDAVSNPQIANTYSLRLDRQVTPSNTLTARYEYYRLAMNNGGLAAPLTLSSAAYNSEDSTQTLQLGDTQILSPKVVNETRFQFIHARSSQTPLTSTQTLLVEGAFNGGGSLNQTYSDHQDRYEFQEYLSFDHGSHLIRTGMRYRLFRDANLWTANFNGQYIFPNLTAYQITLQGQANGQTAKQIRGTCVMTATGQVCGGPSQFSITSGTPSASVLSGDLGAYVEDEWRMRKNLTLTLGFRLESQFGIPDHFDPAPRVGLSWAIQHGKSKLPLVVLRPGFAIFYDRFAPRDILQAVRENGTTEQAVYVLAPDYCPVITPMCNPLASAPVQQPTIYRIDPHLRSQYDIVASISAEHSFGRHGSLSGTYAGYHGVHKFLSRNANAPLPGTYDPSLPNSGVRPMGGTQNVYEYSSDGTSNINLFSATATFIPTRNMFLTAFYAGQHNMSDAAGANTFVSHPYNVHADYGRSGTIAAQRLFLGGQWNMPLGFSLASFVNYHSGLPFNITTGADLNGDTIYNDRPAFATDTTRASVQKTSFGTFDLAPLPSQQIVPVNYGDAPSYITWNMIFNSTVRVGPKRAPAAASASTKAKSPERPFVLGFAVEAQNLLNHVNPGMPVGVLTSPLFGHSIALADSTNNSAANRTVSLRVFFTF